MAVTERIQGGVGGKLREARERRGISVRQIANATKISVGALEALERNDISRLPGGIFSRAFVRSYAIEVGLDPETTIQEFIAQFPNDSVTQGHPASGQNDDNEQIESDRRTASTFLKLIAVSVPLAGIVLYVVMSNRRIGPAGTPPPAKARETASRPGNPPPAEAPFVVGISATAKSFVSAMVDGEQTIEREMASGEHQEVTVRRDIVLTAADAGAIVLTLDGADAKPLGKSGESTTVRLNAQNFEDYLAAR
jgi:cytoskeletal protein RodZ